MTEESNSRSIGELGRNVDALTETVRDIHVIVRRIEVDMAARDEQIKTLDRRVDEMRDLPWKVAGLVSTGVTVAITFLKAKIGWN